MRVKQIEEQVLESSRISIDAMYSTENELRKHIRQRQITNVFAILEKNRLENVYMKQRFQEAILFQEYVSLTKAFDSWRAFTNDSHSRRKTLKRILLFWQELVIDERGKRLAFEILHKVLTMQRKRLIILVLSILKEYIVDFRRLCKSLQGWRTFLSVQSCRMNTFIQKRHRLTQSRALNSWQLEVVIQGKLHEKKKQLLQIVLLSWKQNAQDDIVQRYIVMRKVEEMIDKKVLKMLGLAFYYLRVYSVIRRERKKIRNLAERIRMKSTFVSWRRVTKQHVGERQMILKTIIFNRWQSYSEEMREKRGAALKAFLHWKVRNLQTVLRRWRNYSNDKENRMKIALSLGRHLKSSRDGITSYHPRGFTRVTRVSSQSYMRGFMQPTTLEINDRHAIHRIEAYPHSRYADNVVGRSSESNSNPKRHLPPPHTLDTPMKLLHNQYNSNWIRTTSRHSPSSSNRNQDPIIPSWVREALSKHKSNHLGFQMRAETKGDSSLGETKYCTYNK